MAFDNLNEKKRKRITKKSLVWTESEMKFVSFFKPPSSFFENIVLKQKKIPSYFFRQNTNSIFCYFSTTS